MNLREEFEEYFKKLNTNLCSFERDYHNVDYFYDLIQVGTRTKDINILVKKCWLLINKYQNENLVDTPDFGGVLCVILYNDKDIDLNVFSTLVKLYLDKLDTTNPHCIRWAISLTYRMGELEYYGNYTINNVKCNGKYWFRKCILYNWTKFSSLIVNKQLMAYEKLTRIALDDNMFIDAKLYLEDAIEEFKIALSFDLDKTIGTRESYIYFSTCELSELCDKASQLVKFYQNIDKYGTDEFEKILDNSKRFGALPYIRHLENKIKELESGS